MAAPVVWAREITTPGPRPPAGAQRGGSPAGDGSYAVARENLGTLPGLVAAAALSVGYLLTATVSLTAGVEALAPSSLAQRAADSAVGLAHVLGRLHRPDGLEAILLDGIWTQEFVHMSENLASENFLLACNVYICTRSKNPIGKGGFES